MFIPEKYCNFRIVRERERVGERDKNTPTLSSVSFSLLFSLIKSLRVAGEEVNMVKKNIVSIGYYNTHEPQLASLCRRSQSEV